MKYSVTCEPDGEALGTFEPIRLADGRAAYQSVDGSRLLGILWPDGRYDDPLRCGNVTWELCAETAEHRRLREYVTADWQGEDQLRFKQQERSQ